MSQSAFTDLVVANRGSQALTTIFIDTILTAFPRRWGRNKPDPSAVHRAIRDHLSTVDSSQITSIYDLALIIIDECSKVFFDRTKPDLRPEVVDMFSSAISSIVSCFDPTAYLPTWPTFPMLTISDAVRKKVGSL